MVLSNLEKAVNERALQKTMLQWLETKVVPELTLVDVDHYINEGIQLQDGLKDTQLKISATSPEDLDRYNVEFMEQCDQISTCIRKLKTMRSILAPTAPAGPVPTPAPIIIQTTGGGNVNSGRVKLPEIKLPTFGGVVTEWQSFKDLFKSAVHDRTDVAKSNKLSYLKSCLDGDAKQLISSMQSTDDNYDIAWDLLEKRYENEREIFFGILLKFTNQAVLTGESAIGLRSLLDISQECIRALKNLNVVVDNWDGIIVFLLFQKLDSTTRRYWELSLKDTAVPVLADFFQFLEHQARALAAGGINNPTPTSHQSSRSSSDPVKKTNIHMARGEFCKNCHGDHPLFKCLKFSAMSTLERRDNARRLGMCYNCLRGGHLVAQCLSTKTCSTCGKKHHTMLHTESGAAASDQSSSSLLHHSSKGSQFSQTMLATAVVHLVDQYGQRQPVRALLDGGSTSSFISESCAQRLGLRRQKTNVEVVGVGSTSLGTAKGFVTVKIHPRFQEMDETTHEVTTLVLPQVTERLPTASCTLHWPHLQGLLLADPSYNRTGDVDLLLGADVFWDMLLDGKKKGPSPGSPIAFRSTVGWLIAGNLTTGAQRVVIHHAETNLDERIQAFWELESVPVAAQVLTKEEQQAEDHFHSNTTRDESGRFVVQLPLKEPVSTLGASREMAVRRLLQLERRLEKNPAHRKEYEEFMQEYESLGHMKLVPKHQVSTSKPTYYIPHHFVQKESSTSTKFRVVFDASAKTTSGKSLNDILMVGPATQEGLVSIMMRFRVHTIALTADIAKMYRQVLVPEMCRDLQRIVWRKDPKSSIQEYRLNTVTYGTASGPYSATKALQQLAEEEKEALPLAAAVVKRDFYVDDLLSGASSLDVALQTQAQLLELTRRGGMDLRKWSSNCSQVLEALPLELRETQVPLKIDQDDVIKTLGLRWNPGTDEFSFKVHLLPLSAVTKRNLLSETCKVFDPMGWLAPTIIKAKIMFQQLWKLNIGWDEALPLTIHKEWVQFRGNLKFIENLSISRCILPEGASGAQLHGFCDASEKAYAAAVYLRVKLPSGGIHVSLIEAKTRVAPSKLVSLPRLELCGGVLLSHVMETVQESLKIDIQSVHAWTDSTVVLAWLSSPSSRWKTFVGNRVAEIQGIIPAENWKHVKGVENPTDCASRGIDPSELASHPLWWSGPEWLSKEDPNPQYSAPEPDEDAVNEEMRKTVFVNQVSTQIPFRSLIHSVSTLKTLKKITACWVRFVCNARVRVLQRKGLPVGDLVHRSGELNTKELDDALLLWVKHVQRTEFSSEVKALKEKKPVHSKSKLRSLNPYLDSSQLLRVGGRLKHSSLPADQKNPILLPRHHRMTELIIQHEHDTKLHAGAQLLLSIINQRFWVLGAKDAVKQQIRKCVICTRHRHECVQQLMGDLPAARVTPARAFLKCGVDYAGPFTVRAIPGRSKVTFKSYLALFICLTTRAIHLEVVSSLTTEAFLAAMKRFMGRRGKPSHMYSDCGTNFVGADRELRELRDLVNSSAHKKRISSHLASEGVQWNFNPPGAPHFGGLWEAGVKSVKSHLFKVIGNTRLTFEELTTVMIQIEACLNSRPLTPMSPDPGDMQALTPGHFLIGEPLTATPEPDLVSLPVNRLSRWQLVQQLYQRFWRRWSNEYLTRLQQRPKWLQHRTNVKEGDMVLIKEENLPPLKWSLGRVTSTHPGDDDLTRVVTVWTSGGELKRPVTKLCLLPIDPAIQNDDVVLQNDHL
jgi:hypothetical protein